LQLQIAEAAFRDQSARDDAVDTTLRVALVMRPYCAAQGE